MAISGALAFSLVNIFYKPNTKKLEAEVKNRLEKEYKANKKNNSREKKEEKKSVKEEVKKDADKNDSEPSDFKVDKNCTNDYSMVLDPSKYVEYDSGIKDFKFSYPANFYSKVEEKDGGDESFGKCIKSVILIGNDDSSLKFAVYSNGSSSIQGSLDSISGDSNYKLDSETILKNGLSGDGKSGKIIKTGYLPGTNMPIYDLVTVTDDYVYVMRVATPGYTDDNDKNMKSYYTECLYRMAGFSGSTAECRTYADFLTGK